MLIIFHILFVKDDHILAMGTKQAIPFRKAEHTV